MYFYGNDYIPVDLYPQAMPEKKHKQDDLATYAGRIRWLKRKLFSDSQTRMAKETGVSQSAIANALAGRKSPGLKMLTAIGSHPAVSMQWLLKGIGSPLADESTRGNYFLPVAKDLLVGLPPFDTELLTGEMQPVAASDYRETRYFVRAQQAVLSLELVPGSLLLIESDIAYWMADTRILRDCVCVIRSAEGQLVLGHVEDCDGGVVFLHTAIAPQTPKGKYRRLRPVGTETRTHGKASRSEHQKLALADIAGVAVYIIYRF